MKLGIIRCMQTEDYCPGTTDFKAIKNKIGAFADEDDIELVVFEPACSRVGEWIRSLLLPVSAKGRLLAIPVHLPNV